MPRYVYDDHRGTKYANAFVVILGRSRIHAVLPAGYENC